ncbi:hypothetical protein RUM44_000405 [Polyplax serrata]|uniref:Uncharacterized protein n=1 Tax=Polyplax serrata TaxID=468196 RepID=A0ABR1B6K5_POLSC
MMGLVVGHPLDTIKVRQQILPPGAKVLAVARSTYNHEGVRGFFKGLAYPLLGSGVYNALFFGVYGNCLRNMQGVNGSNIRKMCCEGEPPSSTWHRDVFIAGCIGGTAAVLYSCPLEVIKIKLQSQSVTIPRRPPSVCKKICKTEPVYKGPYDALVKIYKNHGIYGGLFKGTWSMFWRDVPTFGLYMLTYEHVLCLFKKVEDRSPHTSITSQLVAGGIAGIISWVTVAPLDVIKTRLQSDDFGHPIYNGMMDCFKKTVHQEGYKALFLGLSLATTRSFPVNATTFAVYECTMKFCEKCGYCTIRQEALMQLRDGKLFMAQQVLSCLLLNLSSVSLRRMIKFK